MTGQTLFYLNYGYHPKGMYWHVDTRNPHTDNYIKYLVHLQKVAWDAINNAQVVQTRYADAHHSEVPSMKPGDWVLLRRKKADKTKFVPIADGPFQILKVNTNNVELKLPKNSTTHLIVNISRVQLYFGPRPWDLYWTTKERHWIRLPSWPYNGT